MLRPIWVSTRAGDESTVSKTKFAVLDDNFLPKLIEQCDGDTERGLVYILYYTGMHGSILTVLNSTNIKQEGDKFFLQWQRTKTKKTLQAPIPKDKLKIIRVFLDGKKKSLQWYNVLLKKIGLKAGFDSVSTMTFRHTRCIRAWKEGRSLPEVCQVMGTSPEVALRNYSKYKDDQLNPDF